MKSTPVIMFLFITLVISLYTSALYGSEREKRRILWEALLKKCPEKALKINVYGESPALTVVCFRSMGVTYLFDLKKNQCNPVNHAKLLPKGSVNNIVFKKDKKRSHGAFILSFNC